MNDNCWMKDNCNHIDCNTFCLKYFKIKTLFDKCLIPTSRRETTPLYLDKDLIDENAYKCLKNIQQNIEQFIKDGKNLFLWSNITGNGKTSWAIRMLTSHIYNVWSSSKLESIVLFINVPRFLQEIKFNIENRSEYIQTIIKYAPSCDLIVWDDIGTKTSTEFETSYLLNIIGSRVDDGKSNIFTSNCNGEILANLLGARLYSRVVLKADYNIELKGKDKRGIK